MPVLTYEQILNRLAERTYDNTKQLRRGVLQRRNGMEDLYGIPFFAEGDASSPATFFISLSPDYIYLQRFAFKFVIMPYTTTLTGGTDSATVVVDNTSLSVNNDDISPNPHKHTTQSHTHNLITGKTSVQTVSDYWRVHIAGVDVTPYLKEQHDGDWIDMSDSQDTIEVFPSDDTEDDIKNFYDILDVVNMMYDEDTDKSLEDAEAILRPEFKRVEIFSDAPFGVGAYLYLKYDHTNR